MEVNNKGIIWLASYPKSGNTWFRAFITNLTKEGEKEFDINKLETNGIFSARAFFDEIVGVDSADMTWEEQYIYRPKAYRMLSEASNKQLYIKAHDAFIFNEKNKPIFPADVSKIAIYIIRNPLDVAVSYAHHNGQKDAGETVKMMCDEKHGLCTTRNLQPIQLPQKIFSWSSHVNSWSNQDLIEVHIIRYEDMKLEGYPVFKEAAEKMSLEFSNDQLLKAIEATTFDKLKALEEKKGFKEKSMVSNNFFRKGEVGSWREKLKDNEIDALISYHKTTMEKFGYLTESGEPTY